MNLYSAYDLLHKGTLALARAEQEGIRIDLDLTRRRHLKLTNQINQLEEDFKNTKFYKRWDHITKGSVNINADPQLKHYLYNVKKLTPPKLTPSGAGATDEASLKALDIPELNDLIRIRKLKKLRDVYLNGFITEQVNGYIHPNYNLHLARTYRSSCDSPNFQNIPIRDKEAKRIIRTCLYPKPGHQLLEIDYSGLEVGIAACYHKDPTMIEYIKTDPSAMHTDMAKQIFFFGNEFDKDVEPYKTIRNAAKNAFVFPQFYGDYYGHNVLGLSEWVEIPVKGKYKSSQGLELPNGIHIAEHMINNGLKSVDHFTDHLCDIEHHFWNERFSVYNTWKRKWWRQYQKKGYFDTLTGFRCSGVMNKKDVINYPVQGSAFHCLLWSLIELDKIIIEQGFKSRIIGQIHDSILFNIYPPELHDVIVIAKEVTQVKLLNQWNWIIIPLSIEADLCQIDQSWYYKKPIDLNEYS